MFVIAQHIKQQSSGGGGKKKDDDEVKMFKSCK